MNLAFLPDLFALTMLILILLLVRRQYSDERTNAWLLGLLVTLVESVAHTFYAPSGVPMAILHVVVVDGYLLAGLIFAWAASDTSVARSTRILYIAVNGLPVLGMVTVYGLNLRNAHFYAPALAAGAVVGVASSLILRRSRLYAVVQLAAWLAASELVVRGHYREAVYWAIGSIYCVAAINFYRRLERGSTGRIAIVTGFAAWSLFFFLHPWIVFHHGINDVAAHFWNLQKSMISIGMILMLLERNASTHAYLAHHDELTGLPNRRMFAASLSLAVENADRSHCSLAVIVLDLDGFKAINDSHGHPAGDFVLREVATRLRKNVRASDTVARMGGDEFIILANGLGSDLTAWRMAESVRSAVSGPVEFQGVPIRVAGSVGMAMYPEDAHDPIRLLRIADQRMYGRKKAPGSVGRIEPGRAALPSA